MKQGIGDQDKTIFVQSLIFTLASQLLVKQHKFFRLIVTITSPPTKFFLHLRLSLFVLAEVQYGVVLGKE